MDDSVVSTVGMLKGKVSGLIEELRQTEVWGAIQSHHEALNVLEKLCGMEKTDLVSLLGVAGNGASSAAIVGRYEYVGEAPLEAAKKYLRRIAPGQKAASLDEIVDALSRGGLALDKKGRDDLRVSLGRSTMEIYKAGDDIYGLLDSFPHIKRERGTTGRKKAAPGQSDNKEPEPEPKPDDSVTV